MPFFLLPRERVKRAKAIPKVDVHQARQASPRPYPLLCTLYPVTAPVLHTWVDLGDLRRACCEDKATGHTRKLFTSVR